MNSTSNIKRRPFVGHYFAFKNDPLQLLLDASAKNDSIFVLKTFNKPIYFINDPELIQYVTTSHFSNYVKTPATPLRLILGDSIFTTDGEEWLWRRKMYQPALTNSAIQQYVSSVNELSIEFSKKLSRVKQINMTKEITDFTIQVLGKTLFGTSLAMDPAFSDHMNVIMEWVGDRRLKYPFVWPINWPSKKNRNFITALEGMNGFMHEIIRNKKEQLNQIDLLSKFIQEGSNGKSLTEKELRDEVMTIFLAGHETSANVLNWVFYELANHPEIQEEVREETKSIEANDWTYELLKKLPLTINVINETMRLYPPVWHFGRVNIKEDQLGNQVIPAGSSVRISPFAMQRNARFWKDPHVFNPHRFENESTIIPNTFIPFGAGPRLCAGRNFAMMEMVLLVARLVKEHQLTYSGKPAKMHPLITLRTREDIILNVD